MLDAFCDEGVYKPVYYESESFIVFLDIRPLLPGHSLVAPKRHTLYITELNDKELIELRDLLGYVLPKLLRAYGADSYNLSINGGEHAGMVVRHLHIHIVPRSASDPMQGRIVTFYSLLQGERRKYAKDVGKELDRLRRIFRYKGKGTQRRV